MPLARLGVRCGVGALVLTALIAHSVRLARGDEPPDDQEQAPGVLATFTRTGSPEPSAVRVVADLAAQWGNGSPDPRVPADGFSGRWTGSLLVQSPGTHRFLARTDGAVRLKVAGRIVLEGKGEALRDSPIDLPAGFAPIELEYTHDRGPARLAIDWEGPGFGREPLPSRLLFHPPGPSDRADRFEEGRRLADRLGCANCHTILDLPRHPELGPPLTEAGRSIAPRWLDDWLMNPTTVRPRTRMPAFGSGQSRAQAADLAAFLASVARTSAPTAEIKMALNVASTAKGQLLFRSVGCLGCHTRSAGGGANEDDRAAPNLADLRRKRPEAWVAAYLEHPRSGKSPSRHRTDLSLSADEAAHLASYLVSDADADAALERADRGGSGIVEGDARRGLALAEQLRCASCHAIPGQKPHAADLPLTAGARSLAGCLADEHAGPTIPRYALTGDERQALREFVGRLPRDPAPTSPKTLAEDSIRRRNCFGCHARDGRGGTALGTRVADLIARDPALGGLKGTLTPPNLTAVGDKLRPSSLALAVRGAAPTARPWLSVRMPIFSFDPDEADAIAAFFQTRDRMAELLDSPDDAPTHPDAATLERGSQLIGQRGFGCLSCHVLAGRIPPGGEPETLGPDLSLAHRRMTRQYFERWIGNPQRIIAGTPMPQFVQPVPTVPGPLGDQLATIWQLLGSPRVAEIAATATREILKREGDRALVVRDMVLVPEAPATPYTPRALAVGLKNDQALLFDTDRLTWVAWWHRGFLSRTKSGRLWEWHPEGDRLWTTPERQAPVVLVAPNRQLVPPREVRERFGTFDELDFEGSGLRLAYRLHAPGDGFFSVEEEIQPTADGWERTVRVRNVPAGDRPALVEHPPPGATPLGDGSGWTWKAGSARVSLRLTGTPLPPIAGKGVAVLFPPPSADGVYSTRVQLTVDGAGR